MPLTRRERVRAATIDEIKETARQQIAEHGAASLSLRAIAGEMGMTAPALYRYFEGRDDLVTALIVDAYHSLAAALAEARDEIHADHAAIHADHAAIHADHAAIHADHAATHADHAASIIAAANAYRTWALTHAEEYALIFGTPIPDYQAPMEITGPAAAESMSVLIQVLDTAYQAGKLTTGELAPALGEMLQPWIEKLGYAGPPAIIHLALASWAQIHGLVSLELFGHLTAAPECKEVDALFEAEIQAMVARMGIE
jgi:AcrR family transcriptional regulator